MGHRINQEVLSENNIEKSKEIIQFFYFAFYSF